MGRVAQASLATVGFLTPPLRAQRAAVLIAARRTRRLVPRPFIRKRWQSGPKRLSFESDRQRPGQVPGSGTSVLADSPGGTRGKVTKRMYGAVPMLTT